MHCCNFMQAGTCSDRLWITSAHPCASAKASYRRRRTLDWGRHIRTWQSPFRPVGEQRKGVQWGLLLAVSIVFVAIAEALRLPAALLLGPMIAGIVIGVAKGTIQVPLRPFVAAQGVIGCMIGHSVPFSTLDELVRDWPVFLTGVVAVLAAATTLGWLMARSQVLPGTTAIWGTSPGAASAMIVMSESYGADMRLVAVMQYLRVVCVVVIAALVARLWATGGAAIQPAAIVWFPPVSWPAFLGTLAVALAGAFGGMRLRIPAAQLLLPMAISMMLQETGLLKLELPPWLLAASYAALGWTVGLRFTWPILKHAVRALPSILVSVLGLLAICGVIAFALVAMAGVDPLTAYLATSPGGVDSIAIIAASSNVDLPFVMAMQAARLILTLFFSPGIARFVATRVQSPTTT
jgi:membrane AbrB-like protein